MLQSVRYSLRIRSRRINYSTDMKSTDELDIYKSHWPKDLVAYTKSAYSDGTEAVNFHKNVQLQWNTLANNTKLSIGLQNLRYLVYNQVNQPNILTEAVHLLLGEKLEEREYFKLLRFLHKPTDIDQNLRNNLILNVIDKMINDKVQFSSAILKIIWSKKLHWRDQSFTLKVWEKMNEGNVSPNFNILYQALKVAAKRGNTTECQVYYDKIKQMKNLSSYQWKCVHSTYISGLEFDPIAAQAFYDNLANQSTKAKVAVLNVIANSEHITPTKLIEILYTLPDNVKVVGYASIMRGMSKRKLYYDVISVYNHLKRSNLSYDSHTLGILKPLVKAYSELGMYNKAIELLDEHNGKLSVGLIHPLLNTLAFNRERYGVWWIWSNMLTRWEVSPNSTTLSIALRAAFQQHISQQDKSQTGSFSCDYFIVEKYHESSFKYHIKELGRGFKAEFREMTGTHSMSDDRLEHSEMFWRKMEAVFRTIVLQQYPELSTIEPPVELKNEPNWDKLIFNHFDKSRHNSISINSEHFDAYVKILFDKRTSGSYENTNLIILSLSWMRSLGFIPSRQTIFRSIISLNESISPMFMSDIKRIIGNSVNNQEQDLHSQLFALDAFNKSKDVELFYKWLSEWIEIPNELDIFIFWNAEIKRISTENW